MEDMANSSTSDIPNMIDKINTALPGLFPHDDSPLSHSCGGVGSGIELHTFLEEMQEGTSIPHLLEHVVMYLLSRSSDHCSAYCGQRSEDIEHGLTSHYYLVFDCVSHIEGIIAADLGFQLVSAWVDNRKVAINPEVVIEGICDRIRPMFDSAA